jgi:hypothetical protein
MPSTETTIQAFASIGTPDEPTLQQVMESEHWPEWLARIYEELASLKEMGMYEDVDALPPGQKAVGSKWVFKLKCDENGNVMRYKARLVAQGYTQIPGQDFNHTLTPVACWDSIRLLLSLVALHNWELCHIEIKTAYLNGRLKEDIYMWCPKILGPGFWHLLKTIYRLKQSGHEWYQDMDKSYEDMGFQRCESDWSIHHH